jgi:hypothetical protein
LILFYDSLAAADGEGGVLILGEQKIDAGGNLGVLILICISLFVLVPT